MSNLVSGHNSAKLGGGPCCSQMLQGVATPTDRLMDVHFRPVAGWTLWVKCGFTAGCVGCPVCRTWPPAQPTTRLFVGVEASFAPALPTRLVVLVPEASSALVHGIHVPFAVRVVLTCDSQGCCWACRPRVAYRSISALASRLCVCCGKASLQMVSFGSCVLGVACQLPNATSPWCGC